MTKRLLAIGFIFGCSAVAWVILGSTIYARAYSSDHALKSQVERIWGTAQAQHAPTASYSIEREAKQETLVDGKKVISVNKVYDTYPITLAGSDVRVKLGLDYRQKGLLWYSTYVADFTASYRFRNDSGKERATRIAFPFPAAGANYDKFRFQLQHGEWLNQPQARDGSIDGVVLIPNGREAVLNVAYRTQGLDRWHYVFAPEPTDPNRPPAGVTEVRDFRLVMETDFSDIDFPDDSISPSTKERTDSGWRLGWNYQNLIAGVNIGMLMPQKLQPGPLAGQISLFAPVSLFFFIVVMLVLSVVKRIDLHPMHFCFVSAAFFAFHLLLAYLVDHLSIHLAFAIASAVSVALVVSYLRIAVGPRFAYTQAAVAQLVYLVLFSYAFFFKGFTGLAITLGAVLTLFVMMQMTARVNWREVYAKKS